MLARNLTVWKFLDFVNELKGDEPLALLMQTTLLEKSPLPQLLPLGTMYIAKEFKDPKRHNPEHCMDAMTTDCMTDYYMTTIAPSLEEAEALFGKQGNRNNFEYKTDCSIMLRIAAFMMNSNGGPAARTAFAAFCLRNIFYSKEVQVFLHQSNCHGKNFIEITVGKRKYYYDAAVNPNQFYSEKIFHPKILKEREAKDVMKASISRRELDATFCKALQSRLNGLQKALLTAAQDVNMFENLNTNPIYQTTLVLLTTNGDHIKEIGVRSLNRFRHLKPRSIAIDELSLEKKLIKKGILKDEAQNDLLEFLQNELVGSGGKANLQYVLDIQALITKLRFNYEQGDKNEEDLLQVTPEDTQLARSHVPSSYNPQLVSAKVLKERRVELEIFNSALIYKCTEAHSAKAAAFFAMLRLQKIISHIHLSKYLRVALHHYPSCERYVVKLISKDGLIHVYDPDFSAIKVYLEKDYEALILPALKQGAISPSTLFFEPTEKMAIDFNDSGIEFNEKVDAALETRMQRDPLHGRSLLLFAQKHGGNQKAIDRFVGLFTAFPPNGKDMPDAFNYYPSNYSKTVDNMQSAAIHANLSSYCFARLAETDAISKIFNVSNEQAIKDFEHYVSMICAVMMPIFKSGSGFFRAQSAAAMLRAVFDDDNIIVRLVCSPSTKKYFVEVGNDKIGWHVVDPNLNPNVIFGKEDFMDEIHPLYPKVPEAEPSLLPIASLSKNFLHETNKFRSTLVAKIIDILKSIDVKKLLDDDFNLLMISVGIPEDQYVSRLQAELAGILKNASMVEPPLEVEPSKILASRLIDLVPESKTNRSLVRQYLQTMQDAEPPQRSLPNSPNLSVRPKVDLKNDQRSLMVSLLCDHILGSCINEAPMVGSLYDKIAKGAPYNDYDHFYLGMAITLFDTLPPGNVYVRAAVAALHLRSMYPTDAVRISIQYSQEYNMHYVFFGNRDMGWYVLDPTLNPDAVFDAKYYHHHILTTYPSASNQLYLPCLEMDVGFCQFIRKNKLSFTLMFARVVSDYLTLTHLLHDEDFLCLVVENGIKKDDIDDLVCSAVKFLMDKMKSSTQSLANLIDVTLADISPDLAVPTRSHLRPIKEEIGEDAFPRVPSSPPLKLVLYFKRIAQINLTTLSATANAKLAAFLKKTNDPIDRRSAATHSQKLEEFINRGVFAVTNLGQGEPAAHFYVSALLADLIPFSVEEHLGVVAYSAIKIRELLDEIRRGINSREGAVKVEVEYVGRLNRFVVVLTSIGLGKYIYDPIASISDLQPYNAYLANINSPLITVPISRPAPENNKYKNMEIASSMVILFNTQCRGVEKEAGKKSATPSDNAKPNSLATAVASTGATTPRSPGKFTFFSKALSERDLNRFVVTLGAAKDDIDGLIKIFYSGSAPLLSHLPKISQVSLKYSSMACAEVLAFIAINLLDNSFIGILSAHEGVLKSLNLPPSDDNHHLAFYLYIFCFTKFCQGDSFARAAYAAYQLRLMIPDEKISIQLKNVENKNHFVVVIKQEVSSMVYDPTINPEMIYFSGYYYNEIAKALPQSDNNTPFSMNINAAVCAGFKAFALLSDKFLYEIFKDQLQKPGVWEEYCQFSKRHFPTKDFLQRDHALLVMNKLVDTMQISSQAFDTKAFPEVKQHSSSNVSASVVAAYDDKNAAKAVNKMVEAMRVPAKFKGF